MILNHLGIIIPHLKQSITIYSKMGYKLNEAPVMDSIQNNLITILKFGSSPDIELIEPIDENSSIYKFKESYHHIYYEAERGEDIIQKFKEMKIEKIFTKPIIAPALDNREVVFAYLQNETFKRAFE